MPTLNKELILKVADEIEHDGPDRPKFHMGDYVVAPGHVMRMKVSKVRACDTACCVAGHVSLLHVTAPKGRTLGDMGALDHFDRARRRLGLSHAQAFRLFIPVNSGNSRLFPRRRVAAVLRHLAHTDGEVEWDAKKRRAKGGD